MNVQERPLESFALGGLIADPQAPAGGLTRFVPFRASAPAHDAISPFGPPAGPPPNEGFWSGMLQKIFALLSEILAALSGAGGNSQTGSGQTLFSSANGSSTGDPHLAFSGTDATGHTAASHFDSMTGHDDLLDSDSFAGGYRLSTDVTQPNQNGVTYNDSAAITTQDGQTSVRLDRSGRASYSVAGKSYDIANGQSVDLGAGETLARGTDGALTITDDNGQGGRITTTLRDAGAGVDVSATAQNVDLGGDLVASQPVPVLRIRPEELRQQANVIK